MCTIQIPLLVLCCLELGCLWALNIFQCHRNCVSITIDITLIIAVDALLRIDTEDRSRWSPRGRTAEEKAVHALLHHYIVLTRHLLSMKPFFFHLQHHNDTK